MNTTLTINGTVFDLPAGDETARLVAADALQEAGHEDAAAAMRAGFRVAPLLDGRYAVLDATDLEAQLRRLGVAAGVHFEAYLPAGVVRVSDGTGVTEVYGDPDAFDSALAGLDDDAGREDVWAALRGVGADYDYDFVYDYYPGHFGDRFSAEQVGEGTPNDNPVTVYTVATNAGVAYLAGADGVSESAVLEWYRCFSTLAATRAEALGWVGVVTEEGAE